MRVHMEPKRLLRAAHFYIRMLQVVQKGYNLPDLEAARRQHDLVRGDLCICDAGENLWRRCAAWRRARESSAWCTARQ